MNSIDIFGSLKSQANSNTVLGTRLSNMKNSVCPYTQQVISVNSNDTVNVNQATSFGLSLLATQDLNTLVSQLNQGDTALTITDAGVGQIDTKIDNTLIQQWKVGYSEVMNELRTRSIIPTTTTADLGSNASPFRNLYASGNYLSSSPLQSDLG